jgi:RsmE family RNA methyltransferase
LALAAAGASSSVVPLPDRWQRIMVAAMEQSNHPWPLELDLSLCCLNKEEGQAKLHALALEYPQVFTAHLGKVQDQGPKANQQTPLLLIIGPEGGLGEQEVHALQQISANKLLGLPTPILRTPTAVSALYGHLLG